jgi:hypothetical protein
MKQPSRLGEGLRDEQDWHAPDCQPTLDPRSPDSHTCENVENLVGATGFEPATLCSQSRCATRLRYAPTPTIPDFTALSNGVLVCDLRFPGENCRKTVPKLPFVIPLVPSERCNRDRQIAHDLSSRSGE